jgi:hypothetical protein
LSDATNEIVFEMDQVHKVSMDLIDGLEAHNVEVPLGCAGLALTLGRAMSGRTLTVDEELAFTEACLEWAGLYFVDGTAN